MYDKFLDAFDHPYFKDWNIVMNCFDESYLKKIPDNFIVVKESPQIEILKRTTVYVSHGGYNSSLEGIIY